MAEHAGDISVQGEPAHTRTLDVAVFQAEPGWLDARGTILDLRKRGLVPMAGDVQAAGIVHRMGVAARIDLAGPRLHAIRAEQPDVAFEPSPATGGESCRDPVRRIEALAGSELDDGYARRLSAAIGGPLGCSHVLTLAQLLGSSVRTAHEAERAASGGFAERRVGERVFDRSLSIDGLEGPDGTLALALQLADLYLAPAPPDAEPLARLRRQHEIRVRAEVDLGTMKLARLSGAERVDHVRLGEDAAWQPLELAFLAGHDVFAGVARTLFDALGTDPERRPQLDALLNLAPTVIQCMPALANYWRRWRAARGEGSDGADPRPRGDGGPIGGMLDSCYMWRRDGALQRKLSQLAPGSDAGD